jgi:hypothetical protein
VNFDIFSIKLRNLLTSSIYLLAVLKTGDDSGIDAADIENVAESVKLEAHKGNILPTCVSSKV